MKWLSLCLALLLTACSPSNPDAESAQENQPMDKVSKAIQQATAEGDLRFYATQLRGTTYPGLDSKEHIALIEKCGHKFMPGTGDVLKSDEDRQRLKENIAFAEAYNRQLLEICKAL